MRSIGAPVSPHQRNHPLRCLGSGNRLKQIVGNERNFLLGRVPERSFQGAARGFRRDYDGNQPSAGAEPPATNGTTRPHNSLIRNSAASDRPANVLQQRIGRARDRTEYGHGFLYNVEIRITQRKVSLSVFRGFAVLVLLLYLISLSIRIGRQSTTDEARKADVIIVMGAAEYSGRPSPVLRARLDHALQLWKQRMAPLIMTTGGPGGDPIFTEAAVGRSYLMDRGVPPTAIVTEAEGRVHHVFHFGSGGNYEPHGPAFVHSGQRRISHFSREANDAIPGYPCLWLARQGGVSLPNRVGSLFSPGRCVYAVENGSNGVAVLKYTYMSGDRPYLARLVGRLPRVDSEFTGSTGMFVNMQYSVSKEQK